MSAEEEDRLAGLIHLDDDDNEDAELTEQAKQQLRQATALKAADVRPFTSVETLYSTGTQ